MFGQENIRPLNECNSRIFKRNAIDAELNKDIGADSAEVTSRTAAIGGEVTARDALEATRSNCLRGSNKINPALIIRYSQKRILSKIVN